MGSSTVEQTKKSYGSKKETMMLKIVMYIRLFLVANSIKFKGKPDRAVKLFTFQMRMSQTAIRTV